jgi:hypothetical protein
MPKYLPCPTCSAPALATKAGVLHTAGRLSSSTITYLCKRCGRRCTLSSAAFSSLPEMTDVEIAAASCDLPFTSLDSVQSAR